MPREPEQPLVSVIMAAYNGERFIAESVESVLGQTYSNWELVIVDDCSTDSTPGIIGSYAEKDKRITVSRNPANLGAAATRNRAIELSSGEFIANLDQDDICLPDRLERSVSALASAGNSAGLVGSGALLVDEDGDALSEFVAPPIEGWYDGAIVPEFSPLFHSSWLARAELIKALGGYDIRFPGADDYDLYLRLMVVARAIPLPRPVIKYRVYPAQVSMRGLRSYLAHGRAARARASKALRGEPFDFEEEYQTAEGALPQGPGGRRGKAYCHHLMAGRYLYTGHHHKARGQFLASVGADPTFWKGWAGLALTYLPASLRQKVVKRWVVTW